MVKRERQWWSGETEEMSALIVVEGVDAEVQLTFYANLRDGRLWRCWASSILYRIFLTF